MADGFRMTWRGPEVQARTRSATRAALGKGAAYLLARAIPRTPVQDGILRGSGATDVDDTRASVYFDTPYAARQHEEIGWRHPKGGQAKYLETTVMEERGNAQQIVAAEVRRAIGG